MNELNKTLVFVAVALLLTGAAFVIESPTGSGLDAAFNDQGQPFFPDFKDPLACTDLEVVDYDPTTATASRFKVMLKDGKWVIPSHYDYPADAKDRLAKTAVGRHGPDQGHDPLRPGRGPGRRSGVIDPLDAKVDDAQGPRQAGHAPRRVGEGPGRLHHRQGGPQGPGRGERRHAQRYVRVPGQKRTYGVNVKVDLSTRFADWIETNLLKLDAGKVRKVVFDNHKVDPERGASCPARS